MGRIETAWGAALVVAGALLLPLTLPEMRIAADLAAFGREDPASFATHSGYAIERLEYGSLAIDRVRLADGSTRHVHRVGEPRPAWPRTTFDVGVRGARYAGETPPPTAWRRVALPAAVGLTGGVLAVIVGGFLLFARIRRLGSLRSLSGRVLDRAAHVVFGQRAPGAETPTWGPGQGSHGGGGGQVPPHVPYRPEWDPDRRIR